MKNMAAISDLMKVHAVTDELLFQHQRSLLHFEFEKALGYLKAYEAILLSHMADEEEVLLPVYSERAKYQEAGVAKLYYDDHAKMRSYIDLFLRSTAEIKSEAEIERTLLQLLDREAFYLRLCSHHDRRETQYLYPILDGLLTEEEKRGLLNRMTLRGNGLRNGELYENQSK